MNLLVQSAIPILGTRRDNQPSDGAGTQTENQTTVIYPDCVSSSDLPLIEGSMIMWKKAVLALVAVLLVGTTAVVALGWSLSAPVSGHTISRLQDSPQYRGGVFVNHEPESAFELTWASLKDEFFGDQQRVPNGEIPVIPVDPKIFNTDPVQGLRTTWLGHASVLIEIDGRRILTDPMFSERASPFGFIGPKRFHPVPITLENLSGIDAVVISHNHYDHMDEATIRYLAAQGTRFFVPIANGDQLRAWDVPEKQITESDWWAEESLGNLTIIATPARHYSSRGLFDYQETLWASWSLIGPEHRIFYSGDTGYSAAFKEIGDRFGPFDVNIIKIGSYGPGEMWHDIHMPPEESIKVHQDVGGKIMLPVHWGTFNLGRHAWDEPIKRAGAAARQAGVEMVTPRVGEPVTAGQAFISTPWWEKVN